MTSPEKMHPVGIIGGTGLTTLSGLEITGENKAGTPWGMPSAPLVEGRLGDQPVMFLSRHGNPHRIPPHQVNYRANLVALKEAGATAIVAANAVGGITAQAPTGALVLPDQIIDYTYGRDMTLFDDLDEPLVHVDFSWPFDVTLRNALKARLAAAELNWNDGGCYGATQGPRLETAAEIAKDGLVISNSPFLIDWLKRQFPRV